MSGFRCADTLDADFSRFHEALFVKTWQHVAAVVEHLSGPLPADARINPEFVWIRTPRGQTYSVAIQGQWFLVVDQHLAHMITRWLLATDSRYDADSPGGAPVRRTEYIEELYAERFLIGGRLPQAGACIASWLVGEAATQPIVAGDEEVALLDRVQRALMFSVGRHMARFMISTLGQEKYSRLTDHLRSLVAPETGSYGAAQQSDLRRALERLDSSADEVRECVYDGISLAALYAPYAAFPEWQDGFVAAMDYMEVSRLYMTTDCLCRVLYTDSAEEMDSAARGVLELFASALSTRNAVLRLLKATYMDTAATWGLAGRALAGQRLIDRTNGDAARGLDDFAAYRPGGHPGGDACAVHQNIPRAWGRIARVAGGSVSAAYGLLGF
jgi:hypothetical protein